MSNHRIASLALVAVIFTLGGCLHDVEPVSYVGHDSTYRTSTAMGGTGSAWVAPPHWQDHPELGWQVVDPTENVWPPLPLDILERVERGMTQAEVLELLGEPARTTTEVTDIDTLGADWNAEVWVWKFQDSRLTQHELTRDFEVRFGQVRRPYAYPDRPEVVGPDWVVVTRQLY